MTDENKLIDEVLYGLKVPPKQTRQQRKSMKRSEKNIKRNLYDDVLKPLTKGFKEGGALKEGMKGALLGAGLGKKFGKTKGEKPKGEIGKGSADTITGKIRVRKSVKEKEEIKKRAKDSIKGSAIGAGLGETFKVYPSAYKRTKGKPSGKLTGGQAKIDKNKNNKIDAEDFKILRGEPKKAKLGVYTNIMDSPVIQQGFARIKKEEADRKAKEEQMYLREKAKYDEPQKLNQGGGIAIKGTKFKGVF